MSEWRHLASLCLTVWKGGCVFGGDLARIFFFHLCFFFFFTRTPADLLDKMLLILLGVLVLHLIILILLIVSTAASVSNTPRSLKRGEEKKCAPELHDNDLELRLKIAGRCSFEIAVLLFVPDLDCRWRQNQRSLVQLPDKRWRLPLQAGQR